MSDDTYEDLVVEAIPGSESTPNKNKLVETIEQLSEKVNKGELPSPSEERAIVTCPYCGGDALQTASHCKNCGRELIQFLVCLELIDDLRKSVQTSKEAPVEAIYTEGVSELDSPARFSGVLKSFIQAAAMPSLLFIALSYLTLWGTRLKMSEWGPIALVLGVFLLCLSVGATHIGNCMGEKPSKWRVLFWGVILGIWIASLQTGMQLVLDGHKPIEREEYFELFNTVLGVLFAYISGSALPAARRLLVNKTLGVAGFLEVLWRIRFSLISGVFSLLIGFLK